LIAGGLDPWGHSIRALMHRCSEHGLHTDLEPAMQDAATLDKLYIPTRYPNGLPDTTPTEAFTEHEGRIAIQAATRILNRVSDIEL
jgi:HEPN domain-containing protein